MLLISPNEAMETENYIVKLKKIKPLKTITLQSNPSIISLRTRESGVFDKEERE